MRKLKSFLWLSMPFLMFSCLQEGNETLVLNEVNPIDEVISSEIRYELEQEMPIYNGSNPPNIEGVYLVSEAELLSSSLTDDSPGDVYIDLTLKFSDQDEEKNTLSYSEYQEEYSEASSDDVLIVGEGKNFTAYFTATGNSNNIYTKQATIISGTKTSTGIKDIYYAFVMLDKGSDPDNELVDEGTYRIFIDSDGLAKNSTWDKSAIISTEKMSDLNRKLSTLAKSRY